MQKKKLIEVALPLEAINAASAREKSIRHGHPSTLHLWWARRPLAAARAVIFAQMVDDPSANPDLFPTEKAQEKERQRLFKIIEELVQWENTTNEAVLQKARDEIWQSWRRACAENAGHPRAKELFNRYRLPAFHDPFAGGGALPLEAQRLGLEAYASDLNPVAVLINKAMIEIPPKFAGRPPVNPEARGDRTLFTREWSGARSLAEDVRYYGRWMRDEAEKRIGHLYPKIEITQEMAAERPDLKPLAGRKLTVIAWLWARTVKSPNPAFAGVDVPLVSTFMLSTKPGKEAYVEPVIAPSRPSPAGGGPGWEHYRFTVKVGKPQDAEAAKNGTKLARGANFRCVMSGSPISGDYIKAEGRAGRMGARLMAIVAEGEQGRVYLAPTPEHEAVAREAEPAWKPESALPDDPRNFWTVQYGLTTFGDLFTLRQLVALTTFSDLVEEAMERIRRDAVVAWNSLSSQEKAQERIWYPTPVPPALLEAARALRKNMTDAEQLLWQCLRGKQLDGYRFRKQHPIERFVLDFYCPSSRLAIELDGGGHNTPEGRARDAERTAWLQARGIRVLRFWNHEVLDNLQGVLQTIWEALQPPPQPSPAGGGGFSLGQRESTSSHLPPEGGGQEGGKPLRDGGTGAMAYAEAVGVYLGISVSRQANRTATLNFWDTKGENVQQVFARQALPMTWDFVEGNPLSGSTGNFVGQIGYLTRVVETTLSAQSDGTVFQRDAQNQGVSLCKLISTDPPYYDNIGYADLSDFFYVWLRRSLRPVFPDLFATVAVPKAEELVATPYRHGSKEKAEKFFLDGMTRAMRRLAEQAHPAFPVTIYYAFKQSESDSPPPAGEGQGGGVVSTGWDTFLAAVIEAGFGITGTWPMRTEYTGNLKKNVSALASSIVLVCRPRPADAPVATRREFVAALRAELPQALRHLQAGNIAPVDLAQAAIGPGMAVYTRYARVLDAQGQPLTVREALALINQTLDEALAEQEGDFDADSRWAVAWFEQMGFNDGPFGEAETLSKAKNTSVSGMVEAGIAAAGRGRVRLLRPDDLPKDWDPAKDARLTAWETVHHLIRALESGGEGAAAGLVARLGSEAEVARELAYRLYTVCERRKRAAEALAYNGLVQSWPEIARLARESGASQTGRIQGDLFQQEER